MGGDCGGLVAVEWDEGDRVLCFIMECLAAVVSDVIVVEFLFLPSFFSFSLTGLAQLISMTVPLSVVPDRWDECFRMSREKRWRKRLVTIEGRHGLFCLTSSGEVDKCKVSHHLHLGHVAVRHGVEYVEQTLFGRRQWQIAHVQHSHLEKHGIAVIRTSMTFNWTSWMRWLPKINGLECLRFVY